MKKLLIIFLSTITINCWSQHNKFELPQQYFKFSTPFPFRGHYHLPAYSYDTLEDGIWVQFFEVDPKKPALSWSIKNGKIDGEEYYISLIGLIEKINIYEDGGLVAVLHFFESGLKKDSIRYSTDYKNQFLKSWFPNGKLKCIAKYDSQEFWYESGQKKMEKTFNTDAQLHGQVTFWSEDGLLKYKGNWINGIATGTQNFRKRKNGKISIIDFNKIPRRLRYQIVYNALSKNLD